MILCVWQIVPDVLKDHNAFFFRVNMSSRIATEQNWVYYIGVCVWWGCHPTSLTNFNLFFQIMVGYYKALFILIFLLGHTGHCIPSWCQPGKHIFTRLPCRCLCIPLARWWYIPATCATHPQAVEHVVGLQYGCHHNQSFTTDHWLHVPHGSEG